MSASESDPTGILQPVNGASVRRSRSRPLTASAAVASSASAVALAGDSAAGSSAVGSANQGNLLRGIDNKTVRR